MTETQENIYKPEKHWITRMGDIQSISIIDETYKPSKLEFLAFELAEENNFILVETEEGLYSIGGIYYRELIGENQKISLNYNMTASLALEPGAKLPPNAKETIGELIKKHKFEEKLIIKKENSRRTIMRLPDDEPGLYSIAQNVASISKRNYTLSEIKALFL